MTAKDVLKTSLGATQYLLSAYLGDLGDGDFLVRTVPNANHIAWQLGHLIVSEIQLVKQQLPEATYPDLPAGFTERHASAKASDDSLQGWPGKAEYMDLFTKVRAATLANLDRLNEADLDRQTQGQMAKMAPTLGAYFILLSNHTLMHAGQFTVLRRKLGKPVLF